MYARRARARVSSEKGASSTLARVLSQVRIYPVTVLLFQAGGDRGDDRHDAGRGRRGPCAGSAPCSARSPDGLLLPHFCRHRHWAVVDALRRARTRRRRRPLLDVETRCGRPLPLSCRHAKVARSWILGGRCGSYSSLEIDPAVRRGVANHWRVDGDGRVDRRVFHAVQLRQVDVHTPRAAAHPALFRMGGRCAQHGLLAAVRWGISSPPTTTSQRSSPSSPSEIRASTAGMLVALYSDDASSHGMSPTSRLGRRGSRDCPRRWGREPGPAGWARCRAQCRPGVAALAAWRPRRRLRESGPHTALDAGSMSPGRRGSREFALTSRSSRRRESAYRRSGSLEFAPQLNSVGLLGFAHLQQALTRLRGVRLDIRARRRFRPGSRQRDPTISRRAAEAAFAVPFGGIDYFVSHSWSDDVSQKVRTLRTVARRFTSRHGREPVFWIDAWCIDQSDISASCAYRAHLPHGVAGEECCSAARTSSARGAAGNYTCLSARSRTTTAAAAAPRATRASSVHTLADRGRERVPAEACACYDPTTSGACSRSSRGRRRRRRQFDGAVRHWDVEVQLSELDTRGRGGRLIYLRGAGERRDTA